MKRIEVLIAGFWMAGCLRANPVLQAASADWAVQGDTSPGVFSESASDTSPGAGELAFYNGHADAFFGLPNPFDLANPFTFADASGGINEVVATHANVYYYFEAVGPTGTNVPIDIQYSVSASSTLAILNGGGSAADAFVGVYQGNLGTPTQVLIDAHCNTTNCDQNFSGVLHLSASPNFVYLLKVHASAQSNVLGGTGSAEADPFLYIDPGFANAANFQLLLSPGVGNSPPGGSSNVPEPGSLGLLSGGLVAILVIRRSMAASRL